MIVAINYADRPYRQAQLLNTKTAYKKGKVDKVIEFSREDIDNDFYLRNKSILDKTRGGGYWLWKPYIINKALEKISDGDYLIYSDSGSYYINSVYSLIQQMKNDATWILSFALPFLEEEYSKRDIFDTFEMWTPEFRKSKQRLATFIVLKKTDTSINFIQEYLKYSQNETLITDVASKKKEIKNFRENRHDQSIYSLLCKKWGLAEYRDPSEYGLKPELYFLNSEKSYQYEIDTNCKYPQIFSSHRKKNPILLFRIDSWLRRRFPVKIYKYIMSIRDLGYKILRTTTYGKR